MRLANLLRHGVLPERGSPPGGAKPSDKGGWAPAPATATDQAIRLPLPTFGPNRQRRENRMAFAFKLEHEDGTPADPLVLHTAVPISSAGDTIALGTAGTPRVIEMRSVGDDPVIGGRARLSRSAL